VAIVLKDGYLLEGDASVASKVDYTVSGLDGTTLTMLASGQLADAKATLVTASGVDTIAGITLFNTHSSAVSVNLYLNDGSSRQILGIDSFGAGYHATFDGSKLYVYDENGNLQVETSPIAHASDHENGGSDEISVTGLSGLLADDQHVLDAEVVAAAKTVKLDDFASPEDNTDLDATADKHGLMPKLDKVKLDTVDANADVTGSNPPQAHASSHENGGGDEINVAGLSGELADDQPPKAHASNHTDGTDDIQDAAADGATKGISTFTAADFDAAGGVISLAADVIRDADVGTMAAEDAADYLAIADLENPPTEDETDKAPTSEWAYDHAADKDAHHSNVVSIAFIIDGGGSAITTGQKGHLEIPFACTITQVTMLADQSGSIVVDIWKDTYANFPPTDADSITASAPPTISSAQKSQDSTLSGWTTSISAGDILAFNVDSCSTIERATISLKVEKS